MVTLMPIAFPQLFIVAAAKTSTPGAFGIDLGLAKLRKSTCGAAIPVCTGTIKENDVWAGQLLKQTLKKLV